MTTPETIKQIRGRLTKAYWKYLNSSKNNKSNMRYWYYGIKYVSVLFISQEDVLQLEKKTEERFERYIQKIDPKFCIEEVI